MLKLFLESNCIYEETNHTDIFPVFQYSFFANRSKA